MTGAALIRQALDAGVELRLVDGTVKVVGPKSAVELLLEPLRQHRSAVIEAMTPSEPPANPADWRELAQAYHVHHWTCRSCIAAGQFRGDRCDTGIALWGWYAGTPARFEPAKRESRSNTDNNGEIE